MDFGSYQIVKRIATGGMAEIFLAQYRSAEGLEKNVVIKRILPEFSANPEFVESFLNEAKLSAQLIHPNIVQIFELGSIGRSYFIAMEYVRGYDLSVIMRLQRKHKTFLPIPIALRIFCDVCAGLDYAHLATDLEGNPLGVVHRDANVSNVIVSADGRAKVLDFGIAKATAKGNDKTKAGMIKGKFAYLAPEQVRGLAIDRRVDVFAIGVMLYELITNHNPFRGETEYLTLQNIVACEVKPVVQLRPDLSPRFGEIISRAVQRESEDRYPSCGEFQTEVEALATDGLTLAHGEVRAFLKRHEAELEKMEDPTQRSGATDIDGMVLKMGSSSGSRRSGDFSDSVRVSEVVEVMDSSADGSSSGRRGSASSNQNRLEETPAEYFEPVRVLETGRPRWLVPAVAASAVLLLGAIWLGVSYLRSDEPAPVRLSSGLSLEPSGVELVTTPPGASILLSSTTSSGLSLLSGATPMTVTGLELGWVYDFEVRAPGYRPLKNTFKLEQPGLLTLNLALVPVTDEHTSANKSAVNHR